MTNVPPSHVSSLHADAIEATQESRAEALWRNRRRAESLQAQLDSIPAVAAQMSLIADLRVRIVDAIEAAQKAREASALSKELQDTQQQEAILKAQFLQNWKPGTPKTVTTDAGDKVQVRSSSTPVIDDGKAVARILMEKDLWDAAGVQLTAKTDMLVPLIENGVLSAMVGEGDEKKCVSYAHIEEKATLAMVARKAA